MSDGISESASAPRFTTPKLEELAAEVAAARSDLAGTVDELTARLDPRTQAARALAGSKQVFRDAVDPEASPDARRRALLVVGGLTAAVAAVAALVWLRRR